MIKQSKADSNFLNKWPLNIYVFKHFDCNSCIIHAPESLHYITFGYGESHFLIKYCNALVTWRSKMLIKKI